jgi:hypothetical protein
MTLLKNYFGRCNRDMTLIIAFFSIRDMTLYLGGTDRLPSPTRINSSVPPSVRPSVRLSVGLSVCLSAHASKLGIQRKVAQAQQIQSIILQNHEST